MWKNRGYQQKQRNFLTGANPNEIQTVRFIKCKFCPFTVSKSKKNFKYILHEHIISNCSIGNNIRILNRKRNNGRITEGRVPYFQSLESSAYESQSDFITLDGNFINNFDDDNCDVGAENEDNDLNNLFLQNNTASANIALAKKKMDEYYNDLIYEFEEHVPETRYTFADGQPNTCLLIRQVEFTLSRLSSKVPIKTGYSQLTDSITRKRGKIDWEDSMDIYRFKLNKGLSSSQCNRLLLMLRNICARHKVSIGLPKQCRTIESEIEKTINSKYSVREIHIPLSENIIPRSEEIIRKFPQFDFKSLAFGVAIDMVEFLADQMLTFKDTDFYWEPTNNNGDNGKRSEFASGTVFEQLCESVSKDYGNTARVIALSCNIDDTFINKTGSRTACPVYIKFLNTKDPYANSNANAHVVGFAPVLQLSDNELLAMLSTVYKSKVRNMEIIRYIKRYVRLIYLRTLFQPLIDASRNGVMLHIDINWLSIESTRKLIQPLLYIPLIAAFNNDNEGADKLCSISRHTHGYRNCRICNTPSHLFYFNLGDTNNTMLNDLRNAPLTEYLGLRYQLIWYKSLKYGEKSLTDNEKIIRQIIKKFNIQPIHNPCHSLMYYQDHISACNLLFGSGPDFLHTVLLGIVSYNIRWGVVVVHLIGNKQFGGNVVADKYKSNMAEIDKRIKYLEINQPCHPFGISALRLYRGISFLFTKGSCGTNESLAKGVFSGGGIDAVKMREHLFQFALVIGTEGNIIPNQRIVLSNNYKPNPTTIVLKAFYSTLHLLMLLGGNTFTEDSLSHLDIAIRSTICHTLKLFELKQMLGGFTQKLSVIKLHMLMHIPMCIRAFGRPNNINTDTTEHAHISVAKIIRSSSQRKSSELSECLQVAVKKQRTDILTKCVEAN